MWFTENPWPPMAIAGLFALICLGLWSRDRNAKYLTAAILCAGMGVGFYFLERAIVTQGEQLQEDVVQLCDQFRRRQPETLDHFSTQAPELKALCTAAMAMVEVGDDLRLTDFQTTFSNANSRAKVHFRANATISAMGMRAHHPARCVLTYQKEGGQWKIVELERLDPISGKKMAPLAAQ